MTPDHDILRIEGNVTLPEGYKKHDYENYLNKFHTLWEFNFAGTITDVNTSPHVLILKTDLEGLHNRMTDTEREQAEVAASAILKWIEKAYADGYMKALEYKSREEAVYAGYENKVVYLKENNFL